MAVTHDQRRLRRIFSAALISVATPSSVLLACGDRTSARAPDAAVAGTPDGQAPGELLDAGAAETDDVDCSAIRRIGCAPLLYVDAAFLDDASDVETCPLFLPCGLPPGTVIAGCELQDQEGGSIGCSISEQGGCTGGVYQPETCGQIDLLCRCDLFVGGGRRSHGAHPRRRASGRDPLGDYFARMAREEAASIHAFRRLQSELRALGAPRQLVCAAAIAQRDEVRHARIMSTLAARRGVRSERARWRRPAEPPRDLVSVARENAAQGCVRETYGALLATWQAAHATHPRFRRVMTTIAADETRHAGLAWAIARWADGHLDAGAAARVARTRGRALRALRRQLSTRAHPGLAGFAGLPTPHQARALLTALAGSLGM